MPGQRAYLLHRGVLPDYDLVQRIPVRAHYLVRRPREHQVAHLRARVHVVNVLQGQRVPEPDALVRRPATRRQKAPLLGAPPYGLDRRLVLVEADEGLIPVPRRLPNEKLVIVPARGDVVLVVHAPLEPADLLLVPQQLILVVLLRSEVSYQDRSVSAACGDKVAVP